MVNETFLNEFFLSGLTDIPALQFPLFLFFLIIYLLTLIWNSLIIVLAVTDSHLHVPMYFFLGNLASLDLCFSSVFVPRMLFDLHTKRRMITITACRSQIFFLLCLATSENFLLAAMSIDRYTAICQPLHYIQIMSWKACVPLASISWCLGSVNASIQTFHALKLSFCGSRIIEGFFCDLPQLLHISCSDTYINTLLFFAVGVLFACGPLIMTFLSYVSIIKTILAMKAKRIKAFSTCSSHLTVMSIFYGSIMYNYLQPGASNDLTGYKAVSVFYTAIIPLLNPLVFSLRNQDLRRAFQSLVKRIFSNAIW